MGESSERMRILQLIAEGKITAEEGAALLEALEASETAPTQGSESAAGLRGRWLRIHVQEGDQTRVNVRLPLRLVEVGLKIARRFAPEQDYGEIVEALNEAVQEGLSGKIVDITDADDEKGTPVRVEISID